MDFDQNQMETRYRGGGGGTTGGGKEKDANELPSHFTGDSSKSRRGLEEEKEKKNRLTLLILLITLISSFSFVKYSEWRLPTPKTIQMAKNEPQSFIEERAWDDLKDLTTFGSRVCGSEANDVIAVERILKKLHQIEKNKAGIHSIQIQTQKPTGAFYVGFQDGLISSYASIPNIVVRLSSASQTLGSNTNSSVLVNCHFDSVPGSPGASDNMISCVTMLEVLRVMSTQNRRIKNPVIFLFNGAEENGLQGAHGFLKGRTKENPEIEGHPWAKGLRAFVNLEAAGAGGREILFQTGPGNGWLVEIYGGVPHPFGSAIGEEVFQRGLIPSDTDFRIFRDFSHIPGLDMAFIKNGYVYHTKFDTMNQITPGSIQHVGDNSLHIMKSLADLDFNHVVNDPNEKMIFFDLFGYTMIFYSQNMGIFINLTVAFIALGFAWKEARGNLKEIGFNILATLLSWAAGLISSVSMGALLNLLGYPMPYFSCPSSVFLIYGPPCLCAQILVFSYLLGRREEDSWMATKTTLSLILISFTLFSRILFPLTVNIAFGILGWFLSRKIFKQRENFKRLGAYLILGELAPLSLSFYLAIITLDTFVPIMGRSGTEVNPNLFLGLLTALVLILPGFTGLVPILIICKKTFLKISGVFSVLLLLYIIIFAGRVPYEEMKPMRIHLVEVERNHFGPDLKEIRKTEAGYWFFNLDPNIPSFFKEFKEGGLNLDGLLEIDSSNCDILYCGLPFYFPVSKRVKRTHWLPVEKSGIPEKIGREVQFELTGDEFISANLRRLNLAFTGPDHMTIILSPGPGWALKKTSLTPDQPPNLIYGGVDWNGRPTYFIYHGRGIQFERLEFSVDLIREDSKNSNSSSPALDILHSNFYLFSEEMKGRDFVTFSKLLPKWAYTLSWSSIANLYSIH